MPSAATICVNRSVTCSSLGLKTRTAMDEKQVFDDKST
jgi:hypothetical protein